MKIFGLVAAALLFAAPVVAQERAPQPAPSPQAKGPPKAAPPRAKGNSFAECHAQARQRRLRGAERRRFTTNCQSDSGPAAKS